MAAFVSGQHLLLRLHPRFPLSPRPPPASSLPCSARPAGSIRRRPVGARVEGSGGTVEKMTAEVDVDGLVEFLKDDLPHLFDDQGIDRTMYDDRVEFRDPITKHDSIDGYLFNIALLKVLFRPDFTLHHVKQTGPYEITTRWTMTMKFALLPWKPDLIFTGISIMGINPQTQKFCSHADLWDSIEKNDYFSLEGFWDFVKQLRYYKTPDLDTPTYEILKRTANYEVRKYAPFLVVESEGDRLWGSGGFNEVTGYIFGKNSSSEKIPMTTPVFTQAADDALSQVSIQVVLPSEKVLDGLPEPIARQVDLRRVEGGTAAALKFSGRPTEDAVRARERELRSSLAADGLRPRRGCVLARYNDPRTRGFVMVFFCHGDEKWFSDRTLNPLLIAASVWPRRGTRC